MTHKTVLACACLYLLNNLFESAIATMMADCIIPILFIRCKNKTQITWAAHVACIRPIRPRVGIRIWPVLPRYPPPAQKSLPQFGLQEPAHILALARPIQKEVEMCFRTSLRQSWAGTKNWRWLNWTMLSKHNLGLIQKRPQNAGQIS